MSLLGRVGLSLSLKGDSTTESCFPHRILGNTNFHSLTLMKVVQDSRFIVKVLQPCNHDRESEYWMVPFFPFPLAQIRENSCSLHMPRKPFAVNPRR